MAFVGGIEGGSTGSRMVLLDSMGNQIGCAEGPSTNPWLLGLEEVAKRILDLVDSVFLNSGEKSPKPLSHLGLSLSGIDTKENQNELANAIKTLRPNVAQEIHACNDSIGTYLTVCESAAIVLVCGTGSICNYIRSDLTFQRVGGYGHILGDNGSAYWIAHYTVKALIESDDKIIDTEYNMENVRKVVYSYFSIENNLDLLQHFYTNFSKNKIAGLCEHLSIIARDGDEFSKSVFREAGIQLARHVRGALYYAVQDSTPQNANMTVICCGSAFKSWDLFRDGFCDFLKPTGKDKWSGTLTLVQLKTSAAYGAARLSVYFDHKLKIPLPPDSYVKFDEFTAGIRF